MSEHKTLYLQGDVAIQRIDNPIRSDNARDIPRDADDALVLARGELSGHRHVILEESAQFFREPKHLEAAETNQNYVGTLVVPEHTAVRHEEHHTVVLPPGSYIVRRQRIFNPASSINRMLLAGD